MKDGYAHNFNQCRKENGCMIGPLIDNLVRQSFSDISNNYYVSSI